MTHSPPNTSLQAALESLEQKAMGVLQEAATEEALEAFRIQYLGRKDGELSLLLRGLKEVSEAERPLIGALANTIKDRLSLALEEKQQVLGQAALSAQLQSDALDITMPGVYRPMGMAHPLTRVTDEITTIFKGMGFAVLDDDACPEVETEYYNFEALNFPPDHPARDMQDTFYTTVAPHVLLRSQTSNAQIRHMEKHPPPIRVVCPGRVYRNEQVSSRKNVLFHQLEGLLVDEGVRFSDLKGVLHEFIRHFFEGERPTRFRASYFPFTEPSAEVDVQCIFCDGNGCSVCGRLGWLEILGAGMVDPNVLQGVGMDSERYTGFAFGMGLERLAMLKYRINNIRDFFSNDLRFLRQFRG